MPLGRKRAVACTGTLSPMFTVAMATNPKAGAGTLAPLAIGASLVVMAFAGGHVSGGHYDPAGAVAITWKIRVVEVLFTFALRGRC